MDPDVIYYNCFKSSSSTILWINKTEGKFVKKMNLMFLFTCLPSVLWINKIVEYDYIGLKNWMKRVVPYKLRMIGMIDVI